MSCRTNPVPCQQQGAEGAGCWVNETGNGDHLSDALCTPNMTAAPSWVQARVKHNGMQLKYTFRDVRI